MATPPTESSEVTRIEERIRTALRAVLEAMPDLAKQLDRHRKGDVILVNNSFLYRNKAVVKTTKSPLYLAVCLGGDLRPDYSTVGIAEAKSFNTEVKVERINSTTCSTLTGLPTAVSHQLDDLGDLLFILLSQLEPTGAKVSMQIKDFGVLRYDPHQTDPITITSANPPDIVTNQFADVDRLWSAFFEAYWTRKGVPPSDADARVTRIKTSLVSAAAKLHDSVHYSASLAIPGGRLNLRRTLLGQICCGIADNAHTYSDALRRAGTPPYAAEVRREMLRLAYNFATQVEDITALLISLCDLKPVLWWLTLDMHMRFARTVSEIPWSVESTKPSLARYRDSVAGARNRTFHALYAIDRPVTVDLAAVHLHPIQVTLFPRYPIEAGELEYQDKELIAVLRRFHHTPEFPVSDRFLEHSAEIQCDLRGLLKATLLALACLLRAKRARR